MIGHGVVMEGNRKMTGCLQTFGVHCLYSKPFLSHPLITHKPLPHTLDHSYYPCTCPSSIITNPCSHSHDVMSHQSVTFSEVVCSYWATDMHTV